MKIELIDGWKKAPKMVSVICLALSGAIPTVYASMGVLQSTVPIKYVAAATMLASICGIIGRVIVQFQLENGDASDTTS